MSPHSLALAVTDHLSDSDDVIDSLDGFRSSIGTRMTSPRSSQSSWGSSNISSNGSNAGYAVGDDLAVQPLGIADAPTAGAEGHLYAPVRARARARALVPGVYVPTVCFFTPGHQDVDTATVAEHAVRLARAGVTGLATQGSNGEAVHLTHSERKLVTATTRAALSRHGFERMPVIVGCGGQSIRETLEYCREAHEAGGDFALVLPPSYYAPLFAGNSRTIVDFFTAVADESPLPIILYNFPGAVGGMDMSSDVIVELASHPNITGVKLTCGNTGKLARVVSATRRLSTKRARGSGASPSFVVLGGSADFLVQSLAVGGHGILAGLGNLAPKACLRTMELYRQGMVEEARHVQEILSDGDWTAIQGGVVGVKAGMMSWLGYGGHGRSPLPKPTDEQSRRWREGFRDLMALEKAL